MSYLSNRLLLMQNRIQLLIIQRYVLKEYFFSFLIAFMFFFSLFFVNQILVLARNQLAEMVSIINTLRLVIFALPVIIALSVPYASFIGTILSIGKLSEGREILAARAGGVGFRALFFPVLICSILLSIISFFTNDYLLPLGTRNYTRLYQELLYSNSRLIIEPYSVRKYENSIIVTGAINDESIEDLLILDTTDDGTERTITASQAKFIRNTQQQGILTLSLNDVDMITNTDNLIQESMAETMDYNILLENIDLNMTNPSAREMSARDVQTLIIPKKEAFDEKMTKALSNYHVSNESFVANYFSYTNVADSRFQRETINRHRNLPVDPRKSLYDRNLRLYQLELWKKFSIPLAAMTFIFLGFPLGLLALKSGRTLGVIIGFLISSGYWAILTLNDIFGVDAYMLSPILIAFAPNVFMVLVGLLSLMVFFRR